MDAGWESARKAYEAQIARAEAWNQQLQREISDLKSFSSSQSDHYVELQRLLDAVRTQSYARQVALNKEIGWLWLAVFGLSAVLIYTYLAALISPNVAPFVPDWVTQFVHSVSG
jgi:hypothetical protein